MNPRVERRPQLTADELQRLKWFLGGLLSLLAVSTVLYMEIDAWMLMGITALATVATMLRPDVPARIPPLLHTLAFPAIVAFFATDLWLRTEILPSMVRLDILLLLYRNLTYRQRRDDLQIVVLGLFLIVVAGVLTVSITFAAHLLVYAGCALALLLAVTLSDAALGGVKPVPAAPGVVPSWAQRGSWPHLLGRLRKVLDWRVLGLGSLLFAGVVAISALLFLAIPRFQLESGMFLDRFISKKSKSGFSDTIRFGDVTEIQQDNGLALSVDVSDRTQVPAAPYWRMLVLDVYENGTFSSRVFRFGEPIEERADTFVLGGARAKGGDPVYWTFYLESGVSRYLPLLGRFSTLRFREIQNFRLARAFSVLALREEPVTMTAYQVEGFDLSPALADPAFAQRWRDRRQVQVLPRETDRAHLRRAVEELTGGAELTAPEFARRANEWLRARHAYSLTPSIPAGEGDPLVRWLRSEEAGHCELFAGAFVLLARTAGFQARVITGFRGGSWNGYSNNFTIRNSDAHAWAEIFHEGSEAWLRADPLAAATNAAVEELGGEAAVAARLDRSWKARLDSLRVFWYRRIVSFDQRSQVETLRAVKEATQNSGKRLRAALEAAVAGAKAWVLAPWDWARGALVAGVLTIFVALVELWRRFGRGWRRWSGGIKARAEDPVRREAGRWLARIRTSDISTADAGVVHELERLRFGPRGSWSMPERVFRRARQALQKARREGRLTRT